MAYLRRTGADGRDLLRRLDDGARQQLVDLRDYAGMQRSLVRASARGDMDRQEIQRFLTNYERAGPETRAAMRAAVQRSGPDGARFLGNLDPEHSHAGLDTDGIGAHAGNVTDRRRSVPRRSSLPVE